MTPLKRHRSLITLSHDHRGSLLVAQMLKKNAPPYRGMPVSIQEKLQYLLQHFVMTIEPHFHKEETVLFPFIKGRSKEIDEMVSDLELEHIKIAHEINALPHLADPVTAMDRLGILLERHIRKEERELFELIQKNFSDEELSTLKFE